MKMILLFAAALFIYSKKNKINLIDINDSWIAPTYDSISELIDGNWFYTEHSESE